MNEKIKELEKKYYELGQEVLAARQAAEPELVDDHVLVGPHGPVKLSELFDGRTELILVHNMGRTCVYCTLWADGFVSLHDHLLDRAAFVVVSPDSPNQQQEFADSRGWPFKMISDADKVFTGAMGYSHGDDVMPGFSAFTIDESGQIRRTGTSYFGPGDSFCSPFHLFSYLPKQDEEWGPKYSY